MSRTRRSLFLSLLFLLLAACAGGRAGVADLTCDDYLRRAEQQMAKGKYLDARESLETARAKFRSGESDARLLALLGDAHYGLKEWNEAIGAYGEFLSLHPRNPQAPRIQFQVGMCYFNMIRPRDRNPEPALRAVEAFRRLIDAWPRSPEARQAQARLDGARRSLAESELFVGQFYLKKGNYQGAVNRGETILREYGGTGLEEDALWLVADSYRRMKDEEKAGEYFRLLVERFPEGKYSELARAFLAERRG